MERLLSFYNTLFGIEIAVFGIITAVLFVFVQLVYSNFSHKQIKPIFKNCFLKGYFILSVFNLVLTGLGSLFMSLEEYDFVRGLDLRTRFIISNQYFVLLCLFLIFISLGVFLVFAIKNIRYLQPSKILLVIIKNIRYENIRKFLLKKYGIKSPNQWLYTDPLFGDTSTEKLKTFLLEDKEVDMSGKKNLEIEKKLKKAQQQLKIDTKKFNKIKDEIKFATDPFEAINEMTMKAINSVDLRALDEITEIFLSVFEKFISDAPNPNKKNKQKWTPDQDIIENFIDYYCDVMLNTQIEMSNRQKITSLKLKVLDVSWQLAKNLQSKEYFYPLKKLINFWKLVADDEINNNQQVFKTIIGYYREIGKIALDNGQKETLDEVFRDIGWLGERLLSKKVPENKPLMIDDLYQTDFEFIFNVLLSFGYDYNYKKPNDYPLIYFDAVYVIFYRLMQIYLADKDKNLNIKNRIFDCLSSYHSFCIAAIEAKNSAGVALAITDLSKGYKELLKNNIRDIARDIIGLLVGIGAMTAGHKALSQNSGNFLGKSFDIYIMDILEENSDEFLSEISSEVHESHIRIDSGGDREEVWNFIKTLGKRLQTNFGFMFDWETGELYSEDDPRRR